MRFALLSATFLTLVAAGCGAGAGKVKGQIVDNGQPKTFPASSYAVEFTLLDGKGEPDISKSYTAVVETDGSFEVRASGGTLPPGTYQVTIKSPGKKSMATASPSPAARREIKAGDNVITLDLAKPSE